MRPKSPLKLIPAAEGSAVKPQPDNKARQEDLSQEDEAVSHFPVFNLPVLMPFGDLAPSHFHASCEQSRLLSALSHEPAMAAAAVGVIERRGRERRCASRRR